MKPETTAFIFTCYDCGESGEGSRTTEHNQIRIYEPENWQRLSTSISAVASEITSDSETREDWHCESCVENYWDNHFNCENCDAVSHTDTAICTHWNGSECYFCATCAQHYTRKCGNCNEWTHVDHVWFDSNNDPYCNDCAEDVLFHCDHCDNYHHVDDDPCGRGLIHDYNYKPDCVFLGKNTSIPIGSRSFSIQNLRWEPNALYAGFELEIEAEGSHTPQELAAQLLESMPEDFIYLKEDGSISNGFEIVSHPFTFEWMKKNSDIFAPIFDLKKAGARSYSTTTCGMHIHLSRRAFTPLHAFKLGRFFYLNPEFILWLSQRRRSQLNDWSSLWSNRADESFNNVNGNGRIYSDAYFKKKANGDNSHKYRALHWSRLTCEMRIFRGNLNKLSFFKNLEFAFAAFQFTKSAGITQLSPLDFIAYLETNPQFSNLHKWIKERRAKAVIDQGGDPLINHTCYFNDNALNNARNGKGEKAVRVYATAPYLRGGVAQQNYVGLSPDDDYYEDVLRGNQS